MRCQNCGTETANPKFCSRSCAAQFNNRQFPKREKKKFFCETQCVNCDYFKHAEVCHIKSIQDFVKDTPISVINSLENLVALCPNCHWEFDHGLLSPEVLRKKTMEAN